MKRLVFLAFILPIIGIAQSLSVDFSNTMEKTLIFKMKDEYRRECAETSIQNPVFIKISEILDVSNLKKLFPNAKVPDSKTNRFNEAMIDLSLVYQLEYRADIALENAYYLLQKTKLFEYVDVKHYYEFLYVPDDPEIGLQYHLESIKAYEAWDISKGDSNVVIAIIDTGNDADHEDLKNKIAYNYQDPINGIDDDNDGYIDNYMGWNFGEMNNNPQISSGQHGVFVAGIAAAENDNSLGISGVGYHSKFLPIKVADENGKLVNVYEAVVYAAEHGASIINCSWGTTLFSGSVFEQDVINYVTNNLNCLVVAACGNDNNEIPFYPASYKNVVSVAMTDVNDYKGTNSSYGIYVDISAPGQNVYSTMTANTYAYSSGTSFAAPIVAGCAAILKSYFPEMSPLQIAERLRVTSDNIDTLLHNHEYANLLGSGRVNLYKALVDGDKPSVRLRDVNADISNVGVVEVNAQFKNFLAPTQNLQVKLKSLSPYVLVTDSVFQVNELGTMESIESGDEFKIKILENIPPNHKLILKFEFQDGEYSSYDYKEYSLNKNYLTIDTNLIKTTFTANGRVGYTDNNFLQGDGFVYDNLETFMYMGGFLLGVSNDKVSNNLYNNNGYDNDFVNVESPVANANSDIADLEYISVFNDNGASNSKIGLEVMHKAFAWSDSDSENFVIYEYNVVNKNQSNIDNLYAALFVDWDLHSPSYNRAKYDVSSKTIYAWTEEKAWFAGISALTDLPFNKYAFDNDGQNLSMNVSDGFSKTEKFTAMTLNRDSAGFVGRGNDVSSMISYGPLFISPNDTLKVAFVLSAGKNLFELQNAALQANKLYHGETGIFQESKSNFKLYPNPSKEYIYVDGLQNGERYKISIFDNLGRMVYSAKTFNENRAKIDVSTLKNGIWFLKIETNSSVEVQTFIKE